MKKEHVWCKNSGVENTIDINTKMLVIRGERERERERKRVRGSMLTQICLAVL